MSSIIIVEGNVGVGKTTLTDLIASRFGYRAMREPVEENPYLEDFYREQEKYAAPMQFWLMSRRFLMHQEAIAHVLSTGQGVVMDRSIYGDCAFARRLFLDGKISPRDFANYMAMRSVMERFLYVPRTTIFLQARPEVCLERVRARNRDCEKGITLGYLTGLRDVYYEVVAHLKKLGSEIIEFDWNEFPGEDDLVCSLGRIICPNFARYAGLERKRLFVEAPVEARTVN